MNYMDPKTFKIRKVRSQTILDKTDPELEVIGIDYDGWKIGERVTVQEVTWPNRNFGAGIITGFELDHFYNTYRIGIKFDKHPFPDFPYPYTLGIFYFYPKEVKKIEK